MKLDRSIRNTKQCGWMEHTLESYIILSRGIELYNGRRMAEYQLTWNIKFKSLSKTLRMRNQGTYKPDPSMTAITSDESWCV